jgi:2-desacetyl-2-hydroxyethyl bacteriochlorophyllide A dehydrogenase
MLGSASTTPPTDGAFAEFITVRADQCHVLPPQLDDALGALMEPFAVALHAVKRAGSVSGKKVLVTGGGPIGLLALITARAFGAAPAVLSDIVANRRDTALKLGADATLDPAAEHLGEQVRELAGDGFDVVFEASGAPSALRQAFSLVRPGGTIVQIGTLGTEDIPLPANQVMSRETQFIGSFRYGNVFGEAIRLAAAGRVNLAPLISEIFPLAELPQAMRCAFAKDRVMKIQISINQTCNTK